MREKILKAPKHPRISRKKSSEKASVIIDTLNATYVINDLDWAMDTERAAFDRVKNEEYISLVRGRKLLEQLAGCPQTSPRCVTIPAGSQIFRISNRDPLAVAGTLGAGGRLNIGGSQQNALLPALKMFSGIYLSDSVATAEAEYLTHGLPMGSQDKSFSFAPKESLILADFDDLVDSLDGLSHSSELREACLKLPLNGSWGYCKIAQVSQIIGWWLYDNRTDLKIHGVVFSSVRNTNGKNYFIFADSDFFAAQIIGSPKCLSLV